MSKIVLLGLLGAAQIVIGMYYAGEGEGTGAMWYAVSGIACVVIAALAAMDQIEGEIMARDEESGDEC